MENFAPDLSSVLIVDDEKDICYLLNNILRKKHYHTSLAGSLAEAEKFIETQTPSIIFLDNHLPDGFGLDNIRKLKSHNPAMKIIMITAHDSQADRLKAAQQGADFFISKPFTKDTIYQTLDKLSGKNL